MDDDTAGPHNVYLVWLFGISMVSLINNIINNFILQMTLFQFVIIEEKNNFEEGKQI